MHFIIAERDGLRLYIIEHVGYNEYNILEVRRFIHSYYASRFIQISKMDGMKIRVVKEKEFRAAISNYPEAKAMLKYMNETLPF